MKDALPLMKGADAVAITEIVPETVAETYEVSAQSVADYLALHDIQATVDRMPAARDTGYQILQAAADGECDLIVAGAYGHSRFREWALGGVTRTLLYDSALPCLMSH